MPPVPVLPIVFAQLLRDGHLTDDDLQGLGQEKLDLILSYLVRDLPPMGRKRSMLPAHLSLVCFFFVGVC